MRIRFDGKTVVVSGAGHGFGRCIAETFAQLVLAYLAAIYPTQNLRKPLRLESTHGSGESSKPSVPQRWRQARRGRIRQRPER